MASASDKAVITEAANRYGIRPDVLWGVYGTETGFGSNVKASSAGAVGPFQFEPSTARSLGVNPYDFRSAAFGAAKYLSQYKGRGLAGMLSAYNAGPAGAIQPGYVATTEQNARSYGKAPPTARPAAAHAQARTSTEHLGLPGVPGAPRTSESTLHVVPPKLNEAAFKSAQTDAALARLFTPSERSGNPLFTTGALSTAEPNPAEYTTPGRSFTTTRSFPGTRSLPPQTLTAQRPQPGTAPQGTKLGGFLPASAALQVRRIDEGQDVQLRPGEGLRAPGNGRVIAVKSDPNGFGPDYPVIKIESGPKAGTTWYLGHTDTALREGDRFTAGQVIARTSRTGHNAPPGWAEIGAAGTLGQGNRGQGAGVRRLLGT